MWSSTIAIDLGELVVGVRVDSEATADGVRRLLAHRVRDDAEPPPNLSLRFGSSDPRSGVVGKHLLYRAGNLVGRYRQRAGVVDALLAHLGDLVVDDTAVLRIRATALVGEAGATVLPRRALDQVPPLEPRLARLGLVVLPGRAVSLDPATLDVLAPPALDVDREGYRQLVGAHVATTPHGPSRWPLRRWVLPDVALPPTGAGVVVRCAALVENRRAVGGRRTLEAVIAARERVRCRPEPTVAAWIDVLVRG